MQRGLVHVLAWSLATGAAVTLSWWGVHTVMAGTAYDPPRTVPISLGAGPSQHIGQPTEEPRLSSTRQAPPSPSPSTGASPSRSAPRPSRTPSAAPAKPPAAANSGEVKSYRTGGGRVVFELGADAAKLVSATPEPGWSMQVWTNDAWIRVNFSDPGGATYSVFCTWNGYPPLVRIVDP